MITNSWKSGMNTLWRKKIMPFKSKAQRKYLHAKKPKMAKKWEKKTAKGAKLPKKVKRKGSAKKARSKRGKKKV